MSNAFESIPEHTALLARPMSRRVFLSASAMVGALTLKGAVLGGTLQAWADEADQVHFVVYILSRTEVPIMVYDVSGTTPSPLSGCSVTVGSWCTSTQKTATTNADGFAALDVKELSFQRDDDSADVYNFWGFVQLEKDGYRQFYEGNCWIEAGTPTAEDGSRPNTIEITTQPDDGTPYLRALMLDEADIQYARATAYIRASNTAEHAITAQVAAGRANAQVMATLLVNGAERQSLTATAASETPYLAELSFTDAWLSQLSPGDELSVHFGVQGETTYALTSPLAFEESLLVSEDGQKENQMISPGLQANADPEERSALMPEWLGRSGDSLYLSFPFMPVQLFYEDGGRFGVTATLFRIDFLKQRNGENLLDGKKRLNAFWGLSGKGAWDYFKSENQYWVNSMAEAYDSLASSSDYDNLFGCSRLTKDIGVRFQLDASGYGETEKGVDTGTLYTNLDLGAATSFSVSFACTQSVVICYVPAYWSFDLSAAVKVKLLLGMAFENCFENINWFPDEEFKTVAAIHVEAGLSVGLGVAGVCSLGIRGYGFLNSDIIFDFLDDEAPFPQVQASIGCGVQVIAQFLFFKATENVAQLECTVIDEEDVKSAPKQLGDTVQQAIRSISADKMKLVTDADLKGLRESEGTWAGEENPRKLVFEHIKLKEGIARNPVPAGARNLFSAMRAEGESGESSESRNPINGLVPTVEELLWEGCYSNPRIRIIHTADSLEDSSGSDRCFLIRLAVVDVEVPNSVTAFASGGFWQDGAEEEDGEGIARRAGMRKDESVEKLAVVTDTLGNCKVVPVKETEGANGEQVATLADGATATVPRTRLTVSEWDSTQMTWGDAKVVDFIAEGEVYESNRLNAFDVDFDAEAADEDTLLLAITSLERPDDASTNPLDYEKSQYISLVRWNHSKGEAVAAGSTRTLNATGQSLFHPRIVRQFFDDGSIVNSSSGGQRCLVYSYVCEYGEFEGSTIRNSCNFAVTVFDEMSESGGTGVAGAHRLTPPIDVFPSLDVSDAIAANHNSLYGSLFESGNRGVSMDPDVMATGTFEVACPDRTLSVEGGTGGRRQSPAVISWSRPKTSDMEALSFVLSEAFSVTSEGEGTTVSYTPDIKLKSSLLLPKVPSIVKLTSRDQQGLFSYVDLAEAGDTKPVRMVTYGKSDCSLGTIEDTGNTDKTQYFSSFNGRRLYTIRVMRGTNPGLSEAARAAIEAGANFQGVYSPYNSPQAADTSGEKKDVALYQLLEARWVDELQTYYDFYPIAQLSNVPDSIGVVAINDVRTDFTFGTITDIESNTANLYQVAVPKIMAATCSNANPVSPFAAPGDACWYTIDVTNVGNAPITLIAMAAYDPSGNAISTETYSDLSLYVQQSADSVRGEYDESGNPVTDENGCESYTIREDERDTAGILWPGKTRTYKFGFTVPEDVATGCDVDFSVGISTVEDHMDDEDARESLRKFREKAGETAEGTPMIRPFASSSKGGGAQGGATTAELAADGDAAQGNVVYGGEKMVDAVRHALKMRIASGQRVSPSTQRGPANYVIIGADGKPVDQGGTGGGNAGEEGGTALAPTGDAGVPLAATGIAGTLLGAAALGIAAYEQRRAENERARK